MPLGLFESSHRGRLCKLNLPDLDQLLPTVGCNVELVNEDDESFLQPLGK